MLRVTQDHVRKPNQEVLLTVRQLLIFRKIVCPSWHSRFIETTQRSGCCFRLTHQQRKDINLQKDNVCSLRTLKFTASQRTKAMENKTLWRWNNTFAVVKERFSRKSLFFSPLNKNTALVYKGQRGKLDWMQRVSDKGEKKTVGKQGLKGQITWRCMQGRAVHWGKEK